jgi:hypothetical protein
MNTILYLSGISASRRVFGLGDDLVEQLAAVAVLGDADAAPPDVPDVLLGLAKDRLGQHAGTGAEVVDTL